MNDGLTGAGLGALIEALLDSADLRVFLQGLV